MCVCALLFVVVPASKHSQTKDMQAYCNRLALSDGGQAQAAAPPLTMTLMHISGKRGVDSAHFYTMIYKRCCGVVVLVQELLLVKF